MPRETKHTLNEGVYAALITPRREDSASVDLAAALELVDFAARGGADGVAILGATGEFVHFTPEDRLHLIRFAVKRSRLPVIANVSHSTLDGAASLGREAVSLGAAALLLMPPSFFAYGQGEIREFFLRFSAAMGDHVPILLYNLPGFTNSISGDTAAELLSTGRFAGIKDSSGDTDAFLRLKALRDRVPFGIFAGADSVFPRWRGQGADGVISGTACALPELMVALDRSIRSGDQDRAFRFHSRLDEFLAWADRFPAPAAIREATRLRGLKAGPHAVPLGSEGERRLNDFRDWFRGWFPVVEKEISLA